MKRYALAIVAVLTASPAVALDCSHQGLSGKEMTMVWQRSGGKPLTSQIPVVDQERCSGELVNKYVMPGFPAKGHTDADLHAKIQKVRDAILLFKNSPQDLDAALRFVRTALEKEGTLPIKITGVNTIPLKNR